MPREVLYVLVLMAAVGHAVWNALIKGSGDRVLMMAAIRLVGLLFGLGVLLFVSGPSRASWPWLMTAALAHYAYYALLIWSYGIGEMSLVYPLARGSAPVLLAGLAFLAVDERLSRGQAAGVGLASIGILILAFGPGRDLRACGVALLNGATIAGYSFCGGVGVRSAGTVLGFQAWLEILTGIGMLTFAVASRGRSIFPFARASGGRGLMAGVISVAGYLAFLAAVTVLPLAPVAALRETSAIFGTVLGAVVFREEFGLLRISAASLAAAGIVALALSTA